jgi:hypothetical protein
MATTAVLGGGSPELRFVDFPSARGLLPIQGSSGGAAAARRVRRQRHRGLEELICNFLLCLGFSVRTLL